MPGAFRHSVDMVEMAVGEQYHLGRQTPFLYFSVEGFRLSSVVESRVHNRSLPGLVPDQVAAFLQGIEMEFGNVHNECI